ncbi:MAG: HlyD family efflux transporter periplasmic adaptor subunit [Nevskiaceae bacterium]|nr:MAG: HlyD family efflux transporter periplasmic adaptor subunit [Nevskiaceae bacterium]
MSDNVNSQNGAPQAANGNGKRQQLLLIIGGVFLLAGLVWLLLWLFVFSQRETTDDAYVGGNLVAISAQMPGTVIAVLADDTQLVKAGQVLVKLDPTDAAVNLAKARSALAQTVRQARQLVEIAAQNDAAVTSRKLELDRAQADLARREPLLSAHAIAPEEVNHAREAVATARAAYELAQRQAAAAHALVDGAPLEENPAVLQAKAAYRDAWIGVHRGAILSPVTGYVAQRGVQVGQHVQPGQALMSVIPLHEVWIDANFKEVQLAHIRIGQPAEIDTDAYGSSVVFHGKVAGLGAGTGSAFALLPPQNASGNWIKVVQRVPVRIALDAKELDEHPLRIGLSSNVKVDTTDRTGAVLATAPSEQPVASTTVYDQDFATAETEADAVIRANLPAAKR